MKKCGDGEIDVKEAFKGMEKCKPQETSTTEATRRRRSPNEDGDSKKKGNWKKGMWGKNMVSLTKCFGNTFSLGYVYINVFLTFGVLVYSRMCMEGTGHC